MTSALTLRHQLPPAPAYPLGPAAEELYDAFAVIATPAPVSACSHCVTRDDLAGWNVPVDQLSPKLVSKFVRKVGTTWGGTPELMRVTPRLLTLAADQRLTVSRSLVWQQFQRGQWRAWPEPFVTAIETFERAELTRLLRAQPRPAHVAHRWLSQVSVGFDDLTGFTDVWRDAMGSANEGIRIHAVSHLVELLTSSALRPDLPATMADVVPANPGAAAQLTEFLCEPDGETALRAAAEVLADTPSARRLEVAAERLRRFRSAVQST
jgi:hypothetical protein